MFYEFFESAVNYVKGCISNTFALTPYKDKIEKNVYFAIEHTSFFLGGYLTFWNRDWLYDLTMMWEYEFEWSIYVYYYLYFVRYFVQILHLDKKDKDYVIFLIHHIMTLVLLAVSSYRFTRIGVIIALSHDIVDIFLNIAKVTSKVYEISGDTRYNMLSNLSLSFFVVSWIPTRIILNYNILNQIYIHQNLSLEKYIYNSPLDVQISVALLLLNFSLQVFWQILIIKFAYNVFIGVKPKDEKGEEYKIT